MTEKTPEPFAPLPPPPAAVTPTKPSATTKGLSGRIKVWLVVAGLALLLVIAALVAGRVVLGAFLPGLLAVGAVAIIGATVVVRSSRSASRKAMLVTATVLVVALAVPLSLRVVYPVYHHFFGDRSSQAAPSSRVPSPNPPPARSSAPTTTPGTGSGQYKIIVNGQDITAEGGIVSCQPQFPFFQIWVQAGRSNVVGEALVTQTDPPQVQSVALQNQSWQWGKGDPGNVAVTNSGKTYEITGNIAPYQAYQSPYGPPPGSPVPFEFDATCP